MGTAAREVGLDVVEAMAARKLSAAQIATSKETSWALCKELLQVLVDSEIRFSLTGSKQRTQKEFRRVFGKFLADPGGSVAVPGQQPEPCQIWLGHRGNADHGTILATVAEPISLSIEQHYENRPWVIQADGLFDDRGTAFWPPGHEDAGRDTFCVGRSDPCANATEAKMEARARLALAVRDAVLARAEEWALYRNLGVRPPVMDSWLPLHQPTEIFSQRLERPYGTMHRAYHLVRLSRNELSALGRSARGEVFAQSWLRWFRAGGLIAATVLVVVAYQLARHRLRERWAAALRVVSVVAWLVLVAAFAIVL